MKCFTCGSTNIQVHAYASEGVRVECGSYSELIPQDNWDEEPPQEYKERFKDYRQMIQQLGS